MNRRELLLLLGGAMTAARVGHAQQKTRPVIGFLSGASPAPTAPYLAAFHQGLRETGYVEGQNVAIEYRWAGGRYDRLPALAADLVARKVEVIAALGGTPPAIAAKKRSATVDRFRRRRPGRVGLVVSPARAATSPASAASSWSWCLSSSRCFPSWFPGPGLSPCW